MLEIHMFSDGVAGHADTLLKTKQRRGELPASLLADPTFFAWFKANRSAYPVMCGYIVEMELIRSMLRMADEEGYRRLAEEGESPEQVYRAMRADGLDRIASVRVLRELFNLSLVRAKEVTVVADGLATSLGEHEARLVDEVTQAIEDSSEDDAKK